MANPNRNRPSRQPGEDKERARDEAKSEGKGERRRKDSEAEATDRRRDGDEAARTGAKSDGSQEGEGRQGRVGPMKRQTGTGREHQPRPDREVGNTAAG
ncbi:hypothetical protein GCM10009828_008860 [Actinoplanes couchii]|uniref:Uncharacterized protein n=1 Tax=Actinoplanes couchii TaxID=403638 RepID=A0ABQ3XIK4_9ACTN|nr:hypothetical protein Aco03nite_067310 [Actinoplanes couchii]